MKKIAILASLVALALSARPAFAGCSGSSVTRRDPLQGQQFSGTEYDCHYLQTYNNSGSGTWSNSWSWGGIVASYWVTNYWSNSWSYQNDYTYGNLQQVGSSGRWDYNLGTSQWNSWYTSGGSTEEHYNGTNRGSDSWGNNWEETASRNQSSTYQYSGTDKGNSTYSYEYLSVVEAVTDRYGNTIGHETQFRSLYDQSYSAEGTQYYTETRNNLKSNGTILNSFTYARNLSYAYASAYSYSNGGTERETTVDGITNGQRAETWNSGGSYSSRYGGSYKDSGGADYDASENYSGAWSDAGGSRDSWTRGNGAESYSSEYGSRYSEPGYQYTRSVTDRSGGSELDQRSGAGGGAWWSKWSYSRDSTNHQTNAGSYRGKGDWSENTVLSNTKGGLAEKFTASAVSLDRYSGDYSNTYDPSLGRWTSQSSGFGFYRQDLNGSSSKNGVWSEFYQSRGTWSQNDDATKTSGRSEWRYVYQRIFKPGSNAFLGHSDEYYRSIGKYQTDIQYGALAPGTLNREVSVSGNRWDQRYDTADYYRSVWGTYNYANQGGGRGASTWYRLNGSDGSMYWQDYASKYSQSSQGWLYVSSYFSQYAYVSGVGEYQKWENSWKQFFNGVLTWVGRSWGTRGSRSVYELASAVPSAAACSSLATKLDNALAASLPPEELRIYGNCLDLPTVAGERAVAVPDVTVPTVGAGGNPGYPNNDNGNPEANDSINANGQEKGWAKNADTIADARSNSPNF